MNICPLPDAPLFNVIDNELISFMKKIESFSKKKTDTLTGGAFVIVPIIIGVVINLLSVNNNYYTISSGFQGISKQMNSKNNAKSLLSDSDYDVHDYRRREELFKLLTKSEFNDKQLQIYKSFDQSKREQIDIQKCLYILTTSYFDYKYGKNEKYNKTIKSILFFIFSNHLYIVALIAYFVKNDDTQKKNAISIINEASEYMQIEDIYKSKDTFSMENEPASRSRLRQYNNTMKMRSETFPTESLFNPSSIVLEENPMISVPRLHDSVEISTDGIRIPYDVIPERTNPVTRSQTLRSRERNIGKKYANNNNWKNESHMKWDKKKSIGGTRRRPKIKRNRKTIKKLKFN